MSLTSTNFANNAALDKGSEYYGIFSNYYTYMTNVVISGSAPVSSLYCDTVSLSVSGLQVTANTGVAPTGGAITCINCGQINIASSSFQNLKAQKGGAVYIEDSDSGTVTSKLQYTVSYTSYFHYSLLIVLVVIVGQYSVCE